LDGIVYKKVPDSFLSQNYIKLYLKYLADQDSKYQINNLLGLFNNAPSNLLFVYKFNQQYSNVVTTPS
jgi:hypothetical protein